VISAPPFTGAAHVRVIEASPNTGSRVVILDGTVAGTLTFDVATSLRPASVIAITSNA